jgi:light-regulated signal transduction histidine kinase (bacteriophytochrome)
VRRQLAWEVTRERTQARIRALNAALEQRVAQLEASNAELAAFSYTVSHDLRGPLRAILGFSERLESHYVQQLGERGAHYLDRIRAGAQRLGDLVDGLLHLSRLTRTRIEPQAVDLSQIAKHIVRDLRQQSPERRVHVEIDVGMTAAGSRPLLTDLVQNLLQNAWKFTSAREHAEISFSCEERGGERIYTVRDNGVGFDMQFAPKLFTVFQRLHGAEFEGTGIGLATASRILSMHGGRIWAEGEKGKGAAFHFVLAPAAGAA